LVDAFLRQEEAVKVSREQASKNRERIVEVAGQLFCERGFDGIGVADLMKAAGLTHGGFYGHFGCKDDLIAEACGKALARGAQRWTALAENSRGAPLAAIAGNYLTVAHRDHPGKGCLFAALGSDAARQGQPVRGVFSEGLGELIEILAEASPGRSKAQKRKAALAVMAQMVGAIVLARLVNDDALSRDIIEASAQAISAVQ
jgi:TetR/AcrR family transcriptional regulator, transcriptional repressor for nem operon